MKWIDAKDSLPNYGDKILMVNNHSQIYSGKGSVFNKKIRPRDAGEFYYSDYYTHWMLLPEPPTKQGE